MDRLFTDGASARRKFLDRFAQSLNPATTRHWRGFERAMRERNRLLQEQCTDDSWLSSIEDTMAVEGVALACARLRGLDVLAEGLALMPQTPFARASITLEGEWEANLRTHAALDVEDALRATWAQARPRDGAAGRTLSGPHRSDLNVRHAEKDMPAAAASTGEQKALLVGLLLAQAYSVERETGLVPLLLLDEVGAHLDAHRRAALATLLAGLRGQVWMTGTEPHIFADFPHQTHIDLDARNLI